MKTTTGYGTTKAEVDSMADALVKRLNSKRKGWTKSVFQNLGWHYCARHEKCGLVVWPSVFEGSFHAMCEPSYPSFYGSSSHSKCPHRAVESMIKSAEAYGKEIAAHVAKFKSYRK